MAKIENQPAQQDIDVVVEPITLEEFCTRLSQIDRRVEMIGAFHSVEKLAQRVKDTETAFAARYSAFINAPV